MSEQTFPRLDVVGIVTEDMAASVGFYRRLGVDIPADADDQQHVEAALPGGMRMSWDTVEVIKSFYPEWSAPAGHGRIGLAFRCADPSHVDKAYADLVEAGYSGSKEPWDAFWGQRYAVVEDPDGNGVDLFAPLD